MQSRRQSKDLGLVNLVSNAVKEMISFGYVRDNKNMRNTPNAFEKLAEEEIDDI